MLQLLLCISAAALFIPFKGVSSSHCPEDSCTNGDCLRNNARCDIFRDCSDGSDEVDCTGSLRLVDRFGSVSGSAGRLEIYLNNAWGTVCDNNFGGREADIACKELDYLYFSRVGNVTSLGYTQGTNAIVLDNVACSSSDTRLVDCRRSSLFFINCDHSDEVALECTNETSPVRLITERRRTYELSGGRLEIFINGQWGTVCDDSFSIADAHVACRQMGFERANSYGSATSVGYGSAYSSTPIWLDNLGCSLSSINNNDLRLCSHAGVGVHNCNHGEDIILSCTNPGFIRLVGSSSSSAVFRKSGRLEMYWNGAWGTVCNNPYFSYVTAQVACKQLGLESVSRYTTASSLGYPAPFGIDTVLDGVSCSSSSISSLLNCSHNPVGSVSSTCGYFDDVGLACSPLGFSNGPYNGTGGGGGGGGGGSAVGSIIGGLFGVITPIICFITCCILCGAISKNKRNGCQRNCHSRAAVPATTTTTTTTAPTYLTQPQGYPVQPQGYQVQPQGYPVQPQGYPVQPQGTSIQAAHPTQALNLSQGACANPPPIPEDSSWQELPPPSYESATSHPITSTQPGQAKPPRSTCPEKGQIPHAPYPMQGQTPAAPYPMQGQAPAAPYPMQGQAPAAPYPMQGQAPAAPYPGQGKRPFAQPPGCQGQALSPYPTTGEDIAPYSGPHDGSVFSNPATNQSDAVCPSAPPP